ncbi:MAG: N-6 DNA methylase [Candidatus Dadabacteria bacterium]|nr:N-6 DNA methylase [Candidatus Dadabacteria bacterium]
MNLNLENRDFASLVSKPELFRDDNLLKRFEEIHDCIYANDGLSSQQTLEEVVKLLFVKFYDERNGNKEFYISPDETGELERSSLSLSLRKRLSLLLQRTKEEFGDVFESDDKIGLSDLSLGFAVLKLQSVSLSASSSDAQGLAFQKFLSHHEKGGRGQFFTPEPIVDFCVDILQPEPSDLIADPACGSGGFLISSLRYIESRHGDADVREIISGNLFGFDINKSVARMAKMKLLLESNAKTNIGCLNSLTALDGKSPANLCSLSKDSFDGFDIILTNPPFGGKITNREVLVNYDLGYKWSGSNDAYYKTNTLRNSQSTEALFIEKCLKLLKERGRMGIVLPNGYFESPSLQYLRSYIKQVANIMAIVKLPEDAFIPYGTGVKTSLLFVEKKGKRNKKSSSVFFGKINKLGYQGNKNGTPVYKKDQYGMDLKNEKGDLLIDEDFSVVVGDYKSFQKQNHIETEHSFSVDAESLNGRFDYNFYSPRNRHIISILETSRSVKLGDVVEVVKTKSKKLNDSDRKVEYVELSDIDTNFFAIVNSTSYRVHELPSRASFELKAGNIITAIAGNSVGTRKHATALVTEEHEGCICSNGFRVFSNFKINPYYLLYFMKSEMFLKQMNIYRTGAAIPNVSDTDLLNILIDLPEDSVVEQIGRKVQESLGLAQESRKVFESIDAHNERKIL